MTAFNFSFVFIVVSLLFQTELIAQNYHNLVDTSNLWNMTRSIHNGQTYTYSARIDKIDTLIDGEVYQKIVSDTLYLLPEFESYGYLGYIREEPSTKKVYYKNLDYGYPPFHFGQNEERLLYDFSIEIGDTTTVMTTSECNNNGSGYTSLKVDDIDSIQLIDGSERKRWHLEDIFSGDEVFWIEGIGSQFGLYNTSCEYTSIDYYQYSLLCFYSDQNHLYQQQGKDTCGIFTTTGLNNNQISNKIKVYPNPINNLLNVYVNKKTPLEFKLYNIEGKEVFKLKTSKKTNSIDTSFLPDGIYYLKVYNHNSIITYRKLIKI